MPTNHGGVVAPGLQPSLGDHDPRAGGTFSASAYADLPAPPTTESLFELEPTLAGSWTAQPRTVSPRNWGGYVEEGPDIFWFEKVLLNPSRLDLGNILSTIQQTVEVVNTYRRETREWLSTDDFTAGDVTLSGEPAYPKGIAPQSSLEITVTIPLLGSPTVDGYVAFSFDSDILELPVTGTRVILFPFEFEAPVRERLEFKTDVLVKDTGVEQRRRLRRAPRQQVLAKTLYWGEARNFLNALIYNWHARIFGVPIWWEARRPTADIAATDTVFQVDTRYADFRDDGLVAVIQDHKTFEVFKIASHTDSSVTVTTQAVSNWDRSRVYAVPVRLGTLGRTFIKQNRFVANPGMTETDYEFEFLDNEYLGDLTPYSTYNGKLLLDGANYTARGPDKTEGHVIDTEVLDNLIAPATKASSWAFSRPMLNLFLKTHTAEECWQVRQMLHAIGGRFTSFYLPTGREDFALAATVAASSNQMDVDYMDFVRFYGDTPTDPRGHLRIVRTDGSASNHQITAAQVISGTVERLTLDPVVATELTADEVDRIEFLGLVRFETDTIEIEHPTQNETTFRQMTLGIPA